MWRLPCLPLLLLVLACLNANSGYSDELSEQQIQALFPKATRIGEKRADVPAYPVFQLQELLGYAFQSNDLVDLPGFSGRRINLLIGLDTSGTLVGLELLEHHEPIFLHGLGPVPLQNFIQQYKGINVGQRVIVDSGRRETHPSEDLIYVDGVTKATVSVIVLSDTVLLSALKVARQLLSAFAAAPQVKVVDSFTSYDFEALLEQGWVQRWSVSQAEFEAALGRSLDDFPPGTFQPEQGAFTTVTFAYLNAPSIGENLLGKAVFEQLMASLKPGEQAFLILSEGFAEYLEPDFKPGTVADRVSLKQEGLPFALRDANLFNSTEPEFLPGIPMALNARVFVVNTQSGFNPGQPMQVRLNFDVAVNPLVRVQAEFSFPYQLPRRFFEYVQPQTAAPPIPPWVRLWQQRWVEITLLVIGLVVLTFILVYQHSLTARAKLFKRVRWLYLFYTLLFIGWYAQGQLSVVNVYPILQSAVQGIDWQVYLMDPILFILWLYVFFSLFIIGRGAFCGWLCPFGALQEMVGWLAKRFRIRQKKVSWALHRRLNYLKYALMIGLAAVSLYSLTLAEKLAEVEPFKTSVTLMFVRYWPFVLYAIALLAAGLFINKFYCRYLCPLGAGLAMLGRFHFGKWLTRRVQCGSPCTLCFHKCDLKAITPKGQVDYQECVQCLECIVYYNNATLCPPLKKARRDNAQSSPELVVKNLS